jgi:hypothetical protein
MRTLDEAWFRFRDNTKASIVVTKTNRNYQPSKLKLQLAVNLGVCEAALRHTDSWNDGVRAPHPIVPVLTRAIRATIAEPTPESVRDLKAAIDGLFERVAVMSGVYMAASASVLLLDAMSALGWAGKATLFVCAGDVLRANAAGRNALDAVARVLILTGHSSEDLGVLMVELQG